MTLFSFTQYNEDVFSSNSKERLLLSSFSLGLASSAAAVPGQPLLCPRGEGVRSLHSRPLVATALTIQTTSIACYWVQATHMPSDGYGLSIHRYPILCCGTHVPVVTIYVMVKAACFTRATELQSTSRLLLAWGGWRVRSPASGEPGPPKGVP